MVCAARGTRSSTGMGAVGRSGIAGLEIVPTEAASTTLGFEHRIARWHFRLGREIEIVPMFGREVERFGVLFATAVGVFDFRGERAEVPLAEMSAGVAAFLK